MLIVQNKVKQQPGADAGRFARPCAGCATGVRI